MAKNPYAAYDMDADKERNGTYLEGGAFRIKVARAGGKNVLYDTLREAITKPHRRAIQTDTLPKDILARLNAELASKALVKAWEVDENFGEVDAVSDEALAPNWVAGKMHDPESGEVVDATPELIAATFIKYNDLYLQVAGWAGDVENFLNLAELETSSGN